MNREIGGPTHLKDRIASYLDLGGQNGTAAFGQSDLSMSAANNQPARIFIVEDDPVMLRMVAAVGACLGAISVSAYGADLAVDYSHTVAASLPPHRPVAGQSRFSVKQIMLAVAAGGYLFTGNIAAGGDHTILARAPGW